MTKKQTLTYLSSTSYTNIGNLFIDIGTNIAFQKAIHKMGGDYNLIGVGGYNCFYSATKNLSYLNPIWHTLFRFGEKHISKDKVVAQEGLLDDKNAFALFPEIDSHIFIIPGCVLTIPFIRIYGNLIKKAAQKKESKIVFYASSGDIYSNREVSHVKKFLEDIKPYAIVARDNVAYENYHDYATHSYNGIDAGFFTNYLELDKIGLDLTDYVVLTFDKYQNKRLAEDLQANELADKEILFCSHVPVPELDLYGVPRYKGKYLISDNPLDYILLYSNAAEVHTDRVHACVISLSHGTKCKLYSKSPRIELFKSIGVSDVSKGERIDQNKIRMLEEEQIKFISEII